MKDALHAFRRKVRERSEPGAVVVGLNPTGLGLVRSLGRRGTPVLAVVSDLRNACVGTRYCEKVYCPDIEGPELIDTLRAIGAAVDAAPVLLLSRDLCVSRVSEQREALEGYYKFLLPGKETVAMLLNKRLFGAYAMENGFPVPATFCAGDEAGLRRVATQVTYPCILKPVFRNSRWEASSVPKAFTAESGDELVNLYRRIAPLQNEVLVQEWIPGPDSEIYFCLLSFNAAGKPLVHFEGRKLFQWMPACGNTAVAENTVCDVVRDVSVRLFEAVGFKGMGSVEFKRDPRDGRFKITEPTVGRPNLQSDLAVACGVNIPCIVYDNLVGVPRSGGEAPVRSVKWIYEEHLFDLILHRKTYHLGLRAILQALRGKRFYALLARDDPWPFLRFVANVARRVIRHLWIRKAA